jgi:hypothetical protein
VTASRLLRRDSIKLAPADAVRTRGVSPARSRQSPLQPTAQTTPPAPPPAKLQCQWVSRPEEQHQPPRVLGRPHLPLNQGGAGLGPPPCLHAQRWQYSCFARHQLYRPDSRVHRLRLSAQRTPPLSLSSTKYRLANSVLNEPSYITPLSAQTPVEEGWATRLQGRTSSLPWESRTYQSRQTGNGEEVFQVLCCRWRHLKPSTPSTATGGTKQATRSHHLPQPGPLRRLLCFPLLAEAIGRKRSGQERSPPQLPPGRIETPTCVRAGPDTGRFVHPAILGSKTRC